MLRNPGRDAIDAMTKIYMTQSTKEILTTRTYNIVRKFDHKIVYYEGDIENTRICM